MLDPASRIEALIAKAEKALSQEFILAVGLLRDRVALSALADLLEAGRYSEAMLSLEANISSFGTAWTKEFANAAEKTGQFMSRAGLEISFDQTNEPAVRAMRNNRFRVVQGFKEEQRNVVRQSLQDSIARGLNPRDQARRIKASVGLTPHQARAVENYRRALEEGNRSALERSLRDKRFDRTVERAIKEGAPLPPKQIEKMVERYREKMVAHRAQTIARTESLRAVHQGVRATYQQAIQEGMFTHQELRRTWNTAGDDRVRESHVDMDQQERGMDEPFVSGAGNAIMYPTDPDAPAEETIQCRCVVSHTISLSPDVLQGASAQVIIEE